MARGVLEEEMQSHWEKGDHSGTGISFDHYTSTQTQVSSYCYASSYASSYATITITNTILCINMFILSTPNGTMT